jgi:hypothetical protein
MASNDTTSQLISVRGGSGAWTWRPENIIAWKQGRLFDVMPITLELAPILDCNLNCPGCPYAKSRWEQCHGRVPNGKFAEVNEKTVASPDIAKRVLDASREAGVLGVIWTGGGEPTIWSPLLPMLRYSAELKMVNALYTNGVQLGLSPAICEDLLKPETNLAFVRISINAVRPDTLRRHWGVKNPGDVLPQFDGLDELFKARRRSAAKYAEVGRPLPAIQISTIVDKTTVGDLLPLCEAVAGVVGRYREELCDADVMVVRPLTNHRTGIYSVQDHEDSVIAQLLEVCGRQGVGTGLLESAGMKLFLGFGLDRVESGEFRTYGDVLRHEYAGRDYFWANGLFLTAGPDGTVYLCTEHNCDPDWAVGNLVTQSVVEIYHGARRKEILEIVHSRRMGPTVLEPNTRASRLNRVAQAIRSGELSDAHIEQIHRASLREPPLLLS